MIRAALPHLRASRGAVVATGSLMARVPLPTWSSYCAAKHALRGFLNSLAIEEREQRTGVRVAMVHPGPIDTPLFAQSSSATGRKPRVAPDAYGADVVARALVEVVVRPRPEVVLGGETRLLDLAFAAVRPAAEAVLLGIDRWYRSGTEDAPLPGSLWEAPVLGAGQRRHPCARQPPGAAPARAAPAPVAGDAAAPRAAPGDRGGPGCAHGPRAHAPGPGTSAPCERACNARRGRATGAGGEGHRVSEHASISDGRGFTLR